MGIGTTKAMVVIPMVEVVMEEEGMVREALVVVAVSGEVVVRALGVELGVAAAMVEVVEKVDMVAAAMVEVMEKVDMVVVAMKDMVEKVDMVDLGEGELEGEEMVGGVATILVREWCGIDAPTK